MTDKTQSGKPDGDGKPPEGAEKPKSVNDLLSEWDDKAAGSQAAKADDKDDKGGADVMARLTALEQERVEERADKAMQDVLGELKDGLEVDVEDYAVEGWLNEQARQNPKLLGVFQNRDSETQLWNDTLRSLKSEFQEHAGERYGGKKADAGVKSAVRIAKERTTTAGDDDFGNLGELSDADFGMRKAEIFRLAETGQLT